MCKWHIVKVSFNGIHIMLIPFHSVVCYSILFLFILFLFYLCFILFLFYIPFQSLQFYVLFLSIFSIFDLFLSYIIIYHFSIFHFYQSRDLRLNWIVESTIVDPSIDRRTSIVGYYAGADLD